MGLREFLDTKYGKWTAYGLIAVAAVAVIVSLQGNLGESEAAALSQRGTFVCAETGKVFQASIKAGMSVPVESPYSDKLTGYPAEFCYWTADGKVKAEPTPVLMNEYLGKREPTWCPDCSRLVRMRNPIPGPDSKAPPQRGQRMVRGLDEM